MGPVYRSPRPCVRGHVRVPGVRLRRDPSPTRAWALFKCSIWYLAALFGAVALDALI